MGIGLIKVALLASLIVACFKQSSLAGTDNTILPDAFGPDVVDATIGKIAIVEQASLLKPQDRILIRIAWVETQFGTAQLTHPNYYGGIWRVDRAMFDVTVGMFNMDRYSDIFEAISTHLGIIWVQSTWEHCRQPLYSGLAARLFLHNANPIIPPGWSVEQQAIYWRDNYPHDPPTGNVTYFSVRVAELPGCTNKGIDLVFVVDGSGSVGPSNFETSKQFVNDVVDSFEIGSDRTRVGVIQYSSSVNIEFHLNQYTDKSSLQQAISSINYISGGTNTEEALNVMVDEGFKVTNGARELGIPRVAVVLTDGQSQGADRVRVPADRAREEDITIFAIGVTANINQAELNAIANKPNDTYVFEVSNFDAIATIGATLQDTACDQSAELPPLAELNGTIGENQAQNFVQDIPPEGITIILRTANGTVVMYGSTTLELPNSALNDFILTAIEGQGPVEIFIGEGFIGQVPNQNDTKANNETIGKLYISIKGKQATNVFSLVTAEGDVTKPEATEPGTTQPETTEPEGTQPDTTKPDNGVGIVTTTVPYIALIILNAFITARLAIAL
ncbi:integrin alpha-1-like [Asterias rubens]|uniref:integrin alpha-1-like n=1 Tax=Asterias rubens TaxID=7604 RepID=UPI001455D834|nr:integrin alpha-1-like [Asterias rubens]